MDACRKKESQEMSEKLIRDKMPAWIKNNADRPDYFPITHRIATPKEMPALFAAKIKEEAEELAQAIHANDKDRIMDELADLNELLSTAWLHLGFTSTESARVQLTKYYDRGGFSGRVVWDGKGKPSKETLPAMSEPPKKPCPCCQNTSLEYCHCECHKPATTGSNPEDHLPTCGYDGSFFTCAPECGVVANNVRPTRTER